MLLISVFINGNLSTAFATNSATVSVVSDTQDANALFSIVVENDDEGEEIYSEDGLSSITYSTDNPDEFPYLLTISISNYDDENYIMKNEVSVNETLVNIGDFYRSEKYQVDIMDDGVAIAAFEYDDCCLVDFNIVFHFERKAQSGESSSYKASVDTGFEQYASAEYLGNANNTDQWRISCTTYPSESEFDYWSFNTYVVDADTSTWNIRANPLEIELSAATGNAVFTPHFKLLSISLADDLVFNEVYDANHLVGVLDAGSIGGGEIHAARLLAGEEVLCAIPFSISNAISDNHAVFHVKLYSGDSTNSASLISDYLFSVDNLSAGKHTFHTKIAALDSNVSNITVSVDFSTDAGNRDTITKTYTLPCVFLPFQESSTLQFLAAGGYFVKSVATVDGITGVPELLLVRDRTTNTTTEQGVTDNAFLKLAADGMILESITAPSGLKQVKDLTVASDGTIWAYITSTEGVGNGAAGYLAKYYGGEWELLKASKLGEQTANGFVAEEIGHIVAVGTNVIANNKTWNGSEWVSGGHGKNGIAQLEGVYYGCDAQGIYLYNPSSGWTKLLSGNYAYEIADAAAGKLLIKGNGSNLLLFDIKSKSIETVSTSIFSGRDSVGRHIGLDKDGTPLFIFLGYKQYNETQFGGDAVCVLCKYLNGQWVNMKEAAFWAEGEDPNQYLTKARPAAINTTMNPLPGVTVYGAEFGTGHSGSLYIELGNSTITFDPGEGTLNNAALGTMTGQILSAVDRTKVPGASRTDYNLVGWFYDTEGTQEWDADTARMPAKDITLYAKWTEKGNEAEQLAWYKERALASLEKQYNKFSSDDYTGENWAALQTAYESGKTNINAATAGTEHIEDNVTAALNAAVAAMQAVEAKDTSKATIAISMDANALGLGYILEPTLVTVDKGTPVSVVITDLLTAQAKEEYGITEPGRTSKADAENLSTLYPWVSDGAPRGGFYLAQVYYPNQTGYSFPATIQNYITGNNLALNDSHKNGKYLGEFDYLDTSGWVYSVGNKTQGNAEFPGVGASGWGLSDGEVVRWQFTVVGYGADLGADNTAWGTDNIVTVGDKSALTWKVAEINSEGTASSYGNAYASAVTVLTDAEATQAAVDNALAALNAVDDAAAQAAADAAAAKAVDDAIDGIGTVTLSSAAKISAARAAYNALTDTQKALVTKLATLTTAETTLANLQAAADQETADAAAAKSVDDMIDAIGEVTLAKETAITGARAAYTALTETQKAKVTKLDTLTAAETTLAGLKADKAAAEAVDSKIEAIGTVTLASEQAITAARTAYNALTDAQKAQVTKLATLTAAETTLAQLKADKAAVDAVEAKITAIGTVTLASETKITEARAAYDALTDAQKAQVTNLATLTAAETALTALKGEAVKYTDALAGVLPYVKNNTPNPIVGSTGGEWAVFALNRGGVVDADWNAKYLTALAAYVDECNGVLSTVKYTEYSRIILALTSMGYDATKFTTSTKTYDLVSPLLDKQASGAAYMAEKQGNNGTAFALLAVDSHNYLDNAEGKALRAGLIASLKANQQESGGWPISGTNGYDPDTTAAAVYALAPYLNAERASAVGVSVSDVQTMVNKALAFLSGRQNENGSFGSAEADGWVVIALSTLGRDADTDEQFVKNGKSVLDDLLSYYDKESGGFYREDTATQTRALNQMTSEQAAYDLVAYDRYKTGKTALYDMSDMEIKSNAPESADEADKAAAAAVDAQIDAIGTVTLESETAITAARTAYDALTDAQKALVTKYATLTVAESKLTALKNKDNKPDKDKDHTITVTMRLIGAEKATKDVDLGADSYLPNYVTWIPTTSYTLEKGSNVYDLWTTATAAYSIRSVGAENNYVETVYAPSGYALSEFTNGPRSGWMYTINGRHPGFGLCEQELYDGDVVIWHYVNDYSYEVEDWFGNDPNYPALGDGTYWNLWLKANDTTGGSGGGVEGGDKKDDKTDTASGGGTTSDSNTITADDGSQVTTETAKTVETKENEDGSVTETVIETTKTTVVAPDGSTSVTETVVETETTTNSVKNDDGSVTETTGTVEKVTETVTGEDGTKQTTTVTETAATNEITTNSVKNADGSVTNTVTTTDTVKETVTAADGSKAVSETTENRSVERTVGTDGKTTGTGSVSSTTTVKDASGKTLSTAVTEGTVAVDTDDKGTISEVTTAKTVTTAADGTKTETTTVTTEAEMANGTTGKVVADGEGNTISAEASVSQAALEAAVKSGEPIEIPVTVNAASGATVRISLEGAGEGSKLWVEIGTTDTAPGNVAYLKLADGVTKLLTTCKTGSVIVPVEGSCEVIVKDNSKTFSDVDGASWYGDSVTFVTARSIFNGNGDGTFAPTATMNRAMAAQILYNLDGSAKAGDGTSFSDVKAGDWFNGAVGWASGLGVITGYNGAYAPLDAVTRQDLVTILYRYAKAAGYDVSVGSSVNLLSYADGADVKDYAAEAMRWAIANGIIGGYTDGTLRPRNMATRAEVAAIMQRMVQNAVK